MDENKELDWNHEITILEYNYQALKNFGFGYGYDAKEITKEDIQALLDGKIIAFSDGEYSHFMKLKK